MSRPLGTATELERRRHRAVQAVDRGESPELVARTYGVNRASVYRWLKMARQPDGLAAKPHPGSAPRLSSDQLQELEGLLVQGAKAHGWSTDLWTCQRVVQLIRRHFGVSFHHDHVGRFLHTRLKWSPQKPRRRACERDEVAIEYWRRVRFPKLARAARRRGAHLVFLDESGFQLTPTVRRTWAPRGSKPIHDCPQKRERISAISCVTVSPKTRRLNLFFTLLPHNAHGEDVVDFLGQVRRHVGKQMLFWDGSRIHRKSKVVQAYLATQPKIVAEDFPPYAPELNPDEQVWGWSKYGRLANLAASNSDELAEHVVDELTHLQKQPKLLASFLRKSKLAA